MRLGAPLHFQMARDSEMEWVQFRRKGPARTAQYRPQKVGVKVFRGVQGEGKHLHNKEINNNYYQLSSFQ